MVNARRAAGVVVLVAAVSALIGVLIFWNAAPPAGVKIEKLAGDFMKCLPQDMKPAERDEIRGIMDRFCKSATSGKVHPKDVVEIQNDLTQYIANGTIPRSELSAFLSKVGKATRRLDSGYTQPED